MDVPTAGGAFYISDVSDGKKRERDDDDDDADAKNVKCKMVKILSKLTVTTRSGHPYQ